MKRLLYILIILTVLQIGLHLTEILIDLSQSHSDTLWEYLGLSDTFKKGTEKGEVVVFKCPNLSANHSDFPPNHHRDTLRGRPDIRENLVRITHIMLKKRFYLTTESMCGILALP